MSASRAPERSSPAIRGTNRAPRRRVELCGSIGLSEADLLEKWARDAKILDVFEGTQQIQLLIIARQLLKR